MKRAAAVLSAFLLGACATPPPQTEMVPAASKAPAPASPLAAPRKRAAAAKLSARPSVAPALDLKSLEQQLKDTPAIGFLTKLSLKNQVDDLLAQFRSVYDGPRSAGVAQLRTPFDLLLMKVLALVQDKDPALARSIHASREALWGVLADREKFRKLA